MVCVTAAVTLHLEDADVAEARVDACSSAMTPAFGGLARSARMAPLATVAVASSVSALASR